MKQFFLVILVSVGICMAGAYGLGLLDTKIDDLPSYTGPGTKPQPISITALGNDLYAATAFPTIQIPTRHSAEIVLTGVMNPIDSEEVASQVAGRILFIGEEVDDAAVLAAGSMAFMAEPYYPAKVHTGKQTFTKFYRRLYEGDPISQNQMVAMIEPAKPLAEVLAKVVKIRGAEAEYDASIAGMKEGETRLRTAEKLFKSGNMGREDYGAAVLTYEKLKAEQVSKREAVNYAEIDKSISETELKNYEIRPTLPSDRSFIRSLIKQRGAVVKPGDPVMLIQNIDRLQAEALIEEQSFMRLRSKIDQFSRDKTSAKIYATIEPTIIEGALHEILGHTLDVTTVAVGKDSKKIVSGSEDGSVCVWSPQAHAPLRKMEHDSPVKVVVCTPVGAERNLCLVGCANGSVFLWDLDNDNEETPLGGRPIEKAHGNDTAITALAFSPDGKYFATGGSDGTIRLWATSTKTQDGDEYMREQYAFIPANGVTEGHDDAITALNFTPQARLVSASKDKSLRVWHLKEKGAALDRKPMLNRKGDVQQLGVSQDGKWMIFDEGRTLKLMSVEKHLHTHTLSVPVNSTPFETLALLSPDNNLILTAGAPEGRLQLWRAPEGAARGFELRQFATRERLPVTCAAFSPNAGKPGKNSFAVSASGNRIYIWAIPSEKDADEHRLKNVPMSFVNLMIDPTTRMSRVGFGIDNPISERYPNGRFEAGRPVVIVIEEATSLAVSRTESLKGSRARNRKRWTLDEATMNPAAPAGDLERRKMVRLRRRSDLDIVPQRYEGRTYYVVKDPVSLRYYRFKEQEHFLLNLMDGAHTLDEAQKSFEGRFRPERLRLEELEQFGQQLLSMGLVQNESPQAGKLLYENRQKRVRMEWMQTLTNILYIKIPVFDPEKTLKTMLPWLGWMFTRLFLYASFAFMLSAAFLVLTHFETFHSRLPSFESYFNFKNMIYLWIALGVVKVIHEFGHGLSCKAFEGEVHEMGFLLLCFSPAMYCNVSDAWRLPNKWHRILISFAGIYVELMIAAAATFIWWNTAAHPFINNLSLNMMVVCSVSTVMFNGNPLMRYDGYYVLADWLEIPNLRDRANRYLQNLAMDLCLGIEVPPEQYMEAWRRVWFVVFAVISYIYRWVVTFVILKFMATFLKPYKLEVVSEILAIGALASMIGWPLYRLINNVRKRGRLPDMKPLRVIITTSIMAAFLFVVFFVPMPVTRIREHGTVQVQPPYIAHVTVEVPGILKAIHVKEGQTVNQGKILAEFMNPELDTQREKVALQVESTEKVLKTYNEQISKEIDPGEKKKLYEQRSKTDEQWRQAKSELRHIMLDLEKLKLRAPRDGVVIGIPQLEEIGKRWDREQGALFCSVGDRTKLRVLVPLSASDFHLLQENMKKSTQSNPLLATIRVQGHGSKTWQGFISALPQTEAKEIPEQLSNKLGGPIAVKPGTNSNQLVPMNQVFLVGIDFDKADASIAVHSNAQVKIHCEYRSCAWWIYRTVSSTFDVPLMRL